MKKLILLLMLLAIGANAQAREAPQSTLLSDLITGFEVTGGFRWDVTECETTDETRPYIGAQVRLPLGEYAGLFVSGDRDFIEKARGNFRVGIFYRPFER